MDKPADHWATDTADPARIFREMFPRAVRLDWRVFAVSSDLRKYAERIWPDHG